MPEPTTPAQHPPTPAPRLDALVIGAGISGIYQLYRLRELGLDVRLLEAGSGVGGVWFWNRYPGARFDSESYSYGYFFSQRLHEEWSWSEEFAGQPETERYLNHVVDRFGLREHVLTEQRVTAMRYDQAAQDWTVTTARGDTFRARFVVTALGILSAPQFPRIPGLADYTGEWHHTGLWPDRDVEFAGRRVAVIGTGSSGVQIVPFIAKSCAQLTVFQRTPNWCTPINNRPIDATRAAEIRAHIDEIYAATQLSPSGSIHRPMLESSLDMDPEERRAHFERLYHAPGLTMALGNFRDVAVDRHANAALTGYLSEKIRARVTDPEVADRLIPRDHGFGQKRPPLENGYYEMFNRDNVTLVSTEQERIERFTATGIQTDRRHYPVDLIVFATGFEAVVGSYHRIDIRGVDDLPLTDHWSAGPRTYLGMQSAGFPNLFLVGGPQSSAGNIPRLTESQVDWVTACLAHMREHGYTSVEASKAAEDEWIEHVNSGVVGTLQETAESWAFGSNVPGRRRVFLLYAGGLPQYRDKIAEAVADGYRGFTFDGP